MRRPAHSNVMRACLTTFSQRCCSSWINAANWTGVLPTGTALSFCRRSSRPGDLTALATWTLGPAQEVYATGEMTPSGVNGQAAMVLTHGGGARSVLHTTLLTRTPTVAVIAGTAATLTLPGPFFMPGDVVLTSADGDRTVTWAEPQPIGHGGLYHSAAEVALRVTAGELQSPLRPGSDVVAGLWALDEVSHQLGVRYDAAR